MSGIDVIIEDLSTHPHCPHGPTILFSRTTTSGTKRNYYACSACRDRKLCPFFLNQDELPKFSQKKLVAWEEERQKIIKDINHKKLNKTLNTVKQLPVAKRSYCHTCSQFVLPKHLVEHADHKVVEKVTDHQLGHPSEFLPPLEDTKKEAQFLFSQSAVKTITNILQYLNYEKIVCVGTPRIHEFISNNCHQMDSLLLDFDARFHSFYSAQEFCWYNAFNHHFFFPEAKKVFDDFIQSGRKNGGKMALILDPPFGGRVEPLAQTIRTINKQFQEHGKDLGDLPVFWAFPYFMEPQLLNSLPEYHMLDYKVDYDNHPLFQDGPKARKLGSPVRIFTNLALSDIVLPPEEGYKYCGDCEKWVYKENAHCSECGGCTSKDGSTYVHCSICVRCVKPTWEHCNKCNRCAQIDHKCGEIAFKQECFHCKQPGHKKRECTQINRDELVRKRKATLCNDSKRIKHVE